MPGFDKAVVEDIKALEEQRGEGALEQGDLIETQVPTGSDRSNNGSGGSLVDLAEATGISAETLRMRRFVSVRIPAHVRGITSGVAWSSYQALAYIPDEEERFGYLQQMRDADPGTESGRWTLEATLLLLGKEPKNKPAYRVSPRASLEARLETYRRLQADKEVLEAISRELLQAGKETPEQRLQRERDQARQEARDFKTGYVNMQRNLADMKARLEALEALEADDEGVKSKDDEEFEAEGGGHGREQAAGRRGPGGRRGLQVPRVRREPGELHRE